MIETARSWKVYAIAMAVSALVVIVQHTMEAGCGRGLALGVIVGGGVSFAYICGFEDAAR